MTKRGDTRRLHAKVRKHGDYRTATRFLDEQNIPWELCCANGKGHPFLLIGGRLRFPVSSSPRSYANLRAVENNLKRRLKDGGLLG